MPQCVHLYLLLTKKYVSDYYGVNDQYWPDSEQSMSPESRGVPSSSAFPRGHQGQQPQQQHFSGNNPNNLHRNGSNMLNPSHVMSNPPPTPPRKNKIQAEHSRTKDIGTETDSGHVSHVRKLQFLTVSESGRTGS